MKIVEDVKILVGEIKPGECFQADGYSSIQIMSAEKFKDYASRVEAEVVVK